MSRKEALFQSLASCGAILIVFICFCHEYAGHILFPWGPPLFGGPFGWHGVGILGILLGVMLLLGTLRLISFPVVSLAIVVSIVGIVIVVYSLFVHR